MKLLHAIGVFASFIISMSLEARFIEKKLSHELTVWEVEKSTYEEQTEANNGKCSPPLLSCASGEVNVHHLP